MGPIRLGEAVNGVRGVMLEFFWSGPWRQPVAMRHFAAREYDGLDPTHGA